MLTTRKVESLKGKGQRYEVADGGRNGLALRVTPNGVKTWILRYRIDGRPRRFTLGTYPGMPLAEARDEAGKERAKVQKNVDPGEEKRRQHEATRLAREADRAAMTVEKVCSLYIKLYAKPNKRSWAEDDRQFKADVLPAWKNRKAKDITSDDIQALLDSIAARGAPVAANRMKALLSRLFRWALSRRHVKHNPVAGIELPAAEDPRDRVLSEQEVRTFWTGLDATPITDPVRRALKLILVTAQRPGEVCGMTFEELSELDGRVIWTIPGSRRKATRKNKKPSTHVVPLSSLALEIIGEWEEKSGIVFEGPRGAPITTRALGYALRRNVGELDPTLPKKRGKRKRHPIQTEPFTPHDLRRSAATLMSNAGVSGLVKPLILGHSPQGITRQVYDLFDYVDEKTRGLDAWGRRLRSIVTGEEQGKVIQLRDAK